MADHPGQDPNRCPRCGHDWHGLRCRMHKSELWERPALSPGDECGCPTSYQGAPC
jgi:hypothetical protein